MTYCNSKFITCSFGIVRLLATQDVSPEHKLAHDGYLKYACRWVQQAMRFLRNSFKIVAPGSPFRRLGADLDYNVVVEHAFVMTSWFSTPLPG